ncbi:anti-sigma factor family protein [Kineococcus gynurae]|uniref:Anti-sigma factor family protein n=1 Tax=Kineococcus gynurae TaxID=452979 RepID=A0ABV5LNA7_9ACTN
MRGPHLGSRVTPFIDGRLSTDAAARVDAHLSECRPCADDVAAERQVVDQVRALRGPEVSPDLLVRLLDIGGPVGPLPPRDRPMARPARPAVGTAPPRGPLAATRPPASRPARRRGRHGRRPLALALAGSFGLLGVGVAGLLWLGPHQAPPVAELRPSPAGASTASPTP